MTTFAGLNLTLSYPHLNVSVYNFGSPRVGNPAFAATYNQYVANTQRMVHQCEINRMLSTANACSYRAADLIPHVPFIDLVCFLILYWDWIIEQSSGLLPCGDAGVRDDEWDRLDATLRHLLSRVSGGVSQLWGAC